MANAPIRRRRALSSENARIVRQRGHNDAHEFALSIGLLKGYSNDVLAKKDVIDPSGDAHSVKSGVKKWQVFLYGQTRFESDSAFQTMNGIGALLVECINAFPSSFDEYQKHKDKAKQKLRKPMVELANRLQHRNRLCAFLSKSLFNYGEVSYLTVKQDNKFHVFWYQDVVDTIADNVEVCNSRAITVTQVPEQKVLFRYNGINLGELEMRNDSPIHYRQIRFNMIKPVVMELLFTKIERTGLYNKSVLMYGKTPKKFGRWNVKNR